MVREANKLAWFVPGRSLAVALAGTAYGRGSGSQGTRWDRDATPRRAAPMALQQVRVSRPSPLNSELVETGELEEPGAREDHAGFMVAVRSPFAKRIDMT